ncbi:glycoside hydrolase family 1 protein [Clostridium felsineum]|uniref:beta-glucosidase n=1 Tax=Clostridium felsineum TaxID=36839 RepID=A0A1S8KZ91_9CLOT|nr:family 1 glycosylhydrolase [Clostridium felsineum]MCR3759515.1 family 1 glycosylhydrolase [Clostridium felsineum]URZ07612.1 Beta-glucosidase A [Clostridium felsineum]URZ12643.1 Beta-glucosidase A [Clostridium felsineum]
MKKIFAKDFLWGTATSAHQVEGNNINSDVWAEEYSEGSPYKEKSGDAVAHYRLYREDIKLMASLGLKVYRFSIEWARIEPEEGCYSKSEIEHYRDVLNCCINNRIIPMVTMHHFTSPRWLMRIGGWSNPNTADKFARYCEVVFKELGELIPYALTMNEANLPIMLHELFVNFNFIPPVGVEAKSWTAPGWRESAAKACGADIENYFTFHMASDEASIKIIKDAHLKAKRAIKKINPNTKVGLSLALPDVQFVKGGEEKAKEAWQKYFKQYLDAIKKDDFFGIQNYTREVYGEDGQIPLGKDIEVTGAGYEFYPEGLKGAIRKVGKDLSIPIIVTENGIATNNDERRIEFIKRAVKGVEACIEEGINVKGYIYWSTFDNYEWTFGYSMNFGVIGVNRKTQERIVKESARVLGKISKNNGLDEVN